MKLLAWVGVILLGLLALLLGLGWAIGGLLERLLEQP